MPKSRYILILILSITDILCVLTPLLGSTSTHFYDVVGYVYRPSAVILLLLVIDTLFENMRRKPKETSK